MSAEGMRLRKVAADTPILRHEEIGAGVWSLELDAPQIASCAQPGQFVHVKLPGALLRRPLSIADAGGGVLRLIYRTVGKGTKLLSSLKEHTAVNCLGPLGRGFDTNCARALLVGGGMGIAPLLFLAKQFGGRADILMGGKNARELFWTELFGGLVNEMFLTTDDGSLGEKGFTTAYLPKLLEKNAYDRVFACGPQVMMEGVWRLAKAREIACQVSLERHMACGLGACLSCTCEAKDGGARKKVCGDGPVFWAGEVL